MAKITQNIVTEFLKLVGKGSLTTQITCICMRDAGCIYRCFSLTLPETAASFQHHWQTSWQYLSDKYFSLVSPQLPVTHITYHPFVFVPGFLLHNVPSTRRLGPKYKVWGPAVEHDTLAVLSFFFLSFHLALFLFPHLDFLAWSNWRWTQIQRRQAVTKYACLYAITALQRTCPYSHDSKVCSALFHLFETACGKKTPIDNQSALWANSWSEQTN